ncbi:hypothetical protein Q5691_09890 [Microcoleus sp. w1-18aA5]|uniref:hypothetical protein n=1 Tax=unclassified Microcoleus TaxID=2642155 RepID=UPI002FD3695C
MNYSVLIARTLAVSPVEFIPWRTSGSTGGLGGLKASVDTNGVLECPYGGDRSGVSEVRSNFTFNVELLLNLG